MPNSPKATSEPASSKQGDIVLPDRGKGLMPCKIVFLSGPYKGKPLNLGNGVVKSEHNQSAEWRSQEGHSLRLGKNFKSVSGRTFQLTLEFYSPNQDISEWVENCMTLQEIDPQTGNAPTLLYSEGGMQAVAPLICTNIRPTKEHPFPGGKGFHYAKVEISLELIGGKNSTHRFATPLMDTELTLYKKRSTDAERERQGTIAVAEQALAQCLTPEQLQQLQQLLSGNKLADVGELSKLSSSSLVQAAVAGLIPKEALAQLGSKLDDAILYEMARKTSGVGTRYVTPLANAIKTGNVSGLPMDLKQQVEGLQNDFASIKSAIAEQKLTQQSPVFSRSTTAQTLFSIASCGIEMRQVGASGISKQQNNPPEWNAYFESKLGQKASDQTARDQLVTDQINKALSSKEAKDVDLAAKFGVSEQDAKKLRNYQP